MLQVPATNLCFLFTTSIQPIFTNFRNISLPTFSYVFSSPPYNGLLLLVLLIKPSQFQPTNTQKASSSQPHSPESSKTQQTQLCSIIKTTINVPTILKSIALIKECVVV